MNGSYLRRIGELGLVRRFHVRLLAFAAVGVAVVAIIAGFALADSHTTPIGSGVVVINTKLGYSNGAGAGTGIVLTSSGEILTNNHVIDGATTIKIVVPGTGIAIRRGSSVTAFPRTSQSCRPAAPRTSRRFHPAIRPR